MQAQTAAGAAAAVVVVVIVLVGHVRRLCMRIRGAGVGVAQRAAIGRAGGEGAVVLRMAGSVEAVHGVNVSEPRRALLVSRMRVSKLEKSRFGRIGAIESVRHESHRHHEKGKMVS